MGAVVEVVLMEWDVEVMLGVSQHLNIMMMDYLAHHMRQNGKGGSHKKFTGTLEQSTGEDMLTDCAESIMENTPMSLSNASKKAILSSTVSSNKIKEVNK